jgi:hypothetical protein
MWEQTVIDLGNVKKNTKHSFKFKGNVSNIKSIKAGCGCTSVKKDADGIVGSIQVGEIPKHIKETTLRQTKSITISYTDKDEVEKLFITYTIV